jgi:hypothetical protein
MIGLLIRPTKREIRTGGTEQTRGDLRPWLRAGTTLQLIEYGSVPNSIKPVASEMHLEGGDSKG